MVYKRIYLGVLHKNYLRRVLFAGLLIFIAFSSCHNDLFPQQTAPPEMIKLQQLKAVNLSEDMHEVSTKEDEIVLFIALVDQGDSLLQVTQHWSLQHTFKKRKEVLELEQQIVPDAKPNQILVFMLLELDYEPPQDIERILIDWIHAKNSLGISKI